MYGYCVRKNVYFRTLLTPEEIPIKVDCGGGDVGTGVIDQRGEFCFIPVSSSDAAVSIDYKNRRSELWFNAAKLARERRVNLGRLSKETLNRLREQLMAPMWKVNSAGQCEVEPKSDTKKRLGRSPDGADALNLAYFGAGVFRKPRPLEEVPFTRIDQRQSRLDRNGRSPFGRRR
jgi:hypothetical protein